MAAPRIYLVNGSSFSDSNVQFCITEKRLEDLSRQLADYCPETLERKCKKEIEKLDKQADQPRAHMRMPTEYLDRLAELPKWMSKNHERVAREVLGELPAERARIHINKKDEEMICAFVDLMGHGSIVSDEGPPFPVCILGQSCIF